MSTQSKAQGVHFVGSVPYPTSNETFTQVSKALPGRLRRIPDGEPGERGYWVWWLHSIFPDFALNPVAHPAKLAVGRGEADPGPPYWFGNMLPAPERKAGEQMTIKAPNYASAAIESYATFKKLKSEGVIESGVRFQVSIGTSCAVLCAHVSPPFRTEADAVLEPLIIEEVKKIQDAIPAEDLAIQFDLAGEMGLLENEQGRAPDLWFAWFQKGTVMSELIPRLKRQLGSVREGVQLGLHFCYGDIGHQHWAQPLDTGRITLLLTEIRQNITRNIDFVHLPVPVDRDDEDYLKPLAAANIEPSTEVYLGLVREDDPDGTKRRLETALRVMHRPFGIATACGLGRTNESEAKSVLQIAADCAGPTA